MRSERPRWLMLVVLLLAPSLAHAQTVERFGHRWTRLHYLRAHMNRQGDKPECGLFALQSDLAYLNAPGGRPVPPVEGAAVGAVVAVATRIGPTSGIGATVIRTKSLFDTAFIRGYTADGVMTIRDVARLAGDYGYPSALIEHATLDHLRSLLDGGNPVIVGICVSKDGGPTTGPSCNGHVVEILGYGVDDRGRRFVLAKHGWSNDLRVWDADAFYASWQQNGGGAAVVFPEADMPHASTGVNVGRFENTNPDSRIATAAGSANQGFHH